MTRRITTTLALVALSGAALALAQPDRQGQTGGRGQPGQRGGDPSQAFERFDANGDGKLTSDELPGRLAERWLETGDADGDGALTREELAAAFAQRGNQGQPGGPAAQPNFEGSMRLAGRSLAGLRRSELNEESREQDLRMVQGLQQALLGAKGGIQNAPRSEQAQERFAEDHAFHKAMRMDLLKILQESLRLEMAILDGNAESAQASIATIQELQAKAHAIFQPEGEGRGRGGNAADGGRTGRPGRGRRRGGWRNGAARRGG